jgi:hypothetical protein
VIVRTFEKTLAAICAILFILSGVTVLFLFNIERRVFESSTYKQAFEEQGLYERMPALLATALQGMIAQNPGAYPFLKELSSEDWQGTIASLLPPDELRAVADGALDSTFDYVNNRTDSAVITLVPIKARLAGPAGSDIVTQFLSTQPACTFEQLQQMALGFLGGSIALCNPPPEAMGLIAPFIQSQMQNVTAAFPDQVTIIPGADSDTPNDPRVQLHLVRSAVRFSPYFVFLLLLAVAVFAVRSLRDFLVWWGWPLLITGAVAGLFALIGAPVITLLLQVLIQTQGAIFLPPLFAATIAETAGAVTRQILSPVAVQGFILAIIGLFMVGISLFLKNRIAASPYPY